MQPQVTRMKDIDPCDASINTTEYFLILPEYTYKKMAIMIYVCAVCST